MGQESARISSPIACPLPECLRDTRSLRGLFRFCFTASATYIFNDLLDLEQDRIHLNKRKRAFASGDLSVATGLGISLSMLALALVAATWLPRTFLVYLLLDPVTTLAYSLAETHRAGGCRHPLEPVHHPHDGRFRSHPRSCLSLARRLFHLPFSQPGHGQAVQRTAKSACPWCQPFQRTGISPKRHRTTGSFGTSSAYASIVIFALYINGRDVVALYHHPNRMWLITPLLILWVSRVWLLASRGVLDEDPVVFALSDRMSLLLGLGVALIAYSAL